MSNCSVCNTVIKSHRRGKKYCSNACKQAAYTARKRGESIEIPVSVTNQAYSYSEFKGICEALGKDYELSLIDYSFIRFCALLVVLEVYIAELINNDLTDTYNNSEYNEQLY